MNRQQLSLLERAETAVIEQTAALDRLTAAVEAPAKRAETEALRSLPRAPMFAGEKGTILLLKSIPGFAALWTNVVPDEYVLRCSDLLSHQEKTLLACVCGSSTVLVRGRPTWCEGGCRRCFLKLETDVRVHKFPPEEKDDDEP